MKRYIVFNLVLVVSLLSSIFSVHSAYAVHTLGQQTKKSVKRSSHKKRIARLKKIQKKAPPLSKQSLKNGPSKIPPISRDAISSVRQIAVEHPITADTGEQRKPLVHKEQQDQLRALRTTISNLVNEVDKKASVGVKVVLLKNNSTLYEKNADHLFTPASNTKLVTAAAAYHLLGPDYTFKTKVFTDKKIGQHTLQNLYIKGAGDPTLSDKDLLALVKRLKSMGIQEIKGNIIIDTSLFAQEKAAAPGWSTGDGPIFDKSPTGALMVNHSCISIQVKPARMVGKKPIVTIDPHTDSIQIKNEAKTHTEKRAHSLHVIPGPHNSLIIRGTLGKKSNTKFYRMAVENPSMYAGQVLAGILKTQKIQLRGKIISGTVPEKAQFLVEHLSSSLNDIIRHLMKKSDNLYADSLFRLMGAHYAQEPGSWALGKKAVEEFLKTTVGLDTSTLTLFDGGGLSHKNKMSPHHFSQLLTWMYTQSPYKENFIESLPIGGIDGTLRNRMKQTAPHSVKAKTGNLNGVTCLSGYITPKTGLPLIFVIMVNRKNKSALIFKRKLEDQLCKILAAHAFSTT